TPSPGCASSSPATRPPWTASAPSSTGPSACCTTSSPAGQPRPPATTDSTRTPTAPGTNPRLRPATAPAAASRGDRDHPRNRPATPRPPPPRPRQHTRPAMKGHPMTLADPVSPDLKRHLRTLKLGQLLATLPDRLTLARQQKLPHADFL